LIENREFLFLDHLVSYFASMLWRMYYRFNHYRQIC
jgi:hypothetical protein